MAGGYGYMYRTFLRDPQYLLKFHLKSLFVLAAAVTALLCFTDQNYEDILLSLPALVLLSSTNFRVVLLGFLLNTGLTVLRDDFQWWMVSLIPLATIWGLFATSLLHNASHDNIKPRWLNRAIGEILGVAQLVGFPDWTIIHVVHHSFPDDPIKDPHPPLEKNYWGFMLGMRESILKVFVTEYFRLWGQSEKSMTMIRRFGLVSRIEQFCKVMLFWLILSHPVFSYFFVPSIVFKMLHYAWFNYITHRTKPGIDHRVENLNFGLYKLVNFITFGFYFHGNHHINPKIFDPRRLEKMETVRKAA
jgi:fatty acid desaturase